MGTTKKIPMSCLSNQFYFTLNQAIELTASLITEQIISIVRHNITQVKLIIVIIIVSV